MSIGLPDTKLLWGRAGGLCSICQIKLSEDKKSSSGAFPFGEQAHIVGEEEGGPRGESKLSLGERNCYHNLILLCPTCHTKIDKATEEYPVEILHQLKSKHELWFEKFRVSAADREAKAHEMIYAEIVDAAAKLCMFEDWSRWTSYAGSSSPAWKPLWFDNIEEFRRRIVQVPWPGKNQELERSLKTLSINLSTLADLFGQHCELKSDGWVKGDKFYKGAGWNPDYSRQVAEYKDWMIRQAKLITLSTKSANWVADVVRRDLNPSFFAMPGMFISHECSSMDASFFDQVERFTDEEKILEPQPSIDRLQAAKIAEKARYDAEIARSNSMFSTNGGLNEGEQEEPSND